MTQYSENGLLCFGRVFTKMTEQRQKTVAYIQLNYTVSMDLLASRQHQAKAQ